MAKNGYSKGGCGMKMSIQMKKKRKKRSAADMTFIICNTIFMALFVIITLYPVINTLAISLNDGTGA